VRSFSNSSWFQFFPCIYESRLSHWLNEHDRLTATCCCCCLNASTMLVEDLSSWPRYSAACTGSKVCFPAAIAFSALVGGSLQSFRTRYRWYIAGKFVLRWPIRPKQSKLE
jgi:hypothetical protein